MYICSLCRFIKVYDQFEPVDDGTESKVRMYVCICMHVFIVCMHAPIAWKSFFNFSYPLKRPAELY